MRNLFNIEFGVIEKPHINAAWFKKRAGQIMTKNMDQKNAMVMHGPWQYGWSLPRRIVVRGLPEMTLVHFFLPWAYTKFGFIEPFGYLS